MQINSLHSLSSLPPTARGAGPKPSAPVESPQPVSSPVDQLDLSTEAQQVLASQPAEGDMRGDRVASIRQAIAEGTYETPEKMSAALDRLLDSFA